MGTTRDQATCRPALGIVRTNRIGRDGGREGLSKITQAIVRSSNSMFLTNRDIIKSGTTLLATNGLSLRCL